MDFKKNKGNVRSMFMNSFSTSADTKAALAKYPEIIKGSWEVVQNKVTHPCTQFLFRPLRVALRRLCLPPQKFPRVSRCRSSGKVPTITAPSGHPLMSCRSGAGCGVGG